MIIKNGYWLDPNSLDTPVIVKCQNLPENCQSENPTIIFNNETKTNETVYCAEGHLGPLCETCDINGDVWGEPYSRSG